MSEKRFKKGINFSCVDTETGKSYWYACNLCGLLNELSEEKEYFEIKKEYFLSKWSIANAENIQLRQEIKELKKENEQLKSLLNACEEGQKSLMEEMKHNDESLDKIWEIMKDLYGVKDGV